MNLGMPRIGPARALKRGVEAYWSGTIDATQLDVVARERRADAWRTQAVAGIDHIPSNDFSLYDQMLDACCLVGAVPARFNFGGGIVDLETYFAMARGGDHGSSGVLPLEMTKWFDTNYHYLVPELGLETEFALGCERPVDQFREALELGVATRPVLIGPVTFLLLSAATDVGFSPLQLLPRILPVYAQVLRDLTAAGADWIQLDEPALVTDLPAAARDAYAQAYEVLAAASPARLLVATYFGGLRDNLETAAALPVDGLHVDIVRAPEQLTPLVGTLPPNRVLSVGAIDGRNVWRTDLRRAVDALGEVHAQLGDRLWLGPSCSLLHVPDDLELETEIDPTVREWLAFGRQKLDEIAVLTTALNDGEDAVRGQLDASDRAVWARANSSATRSAAVRRRAAAITSADAARASTYSQRHETQLEELSLPVLPMTTIGSFPQTADIRAARRRHDRGELSDNDYRAFCEREIASVIAEQEALGLDVLVHGEPERNDMVQYFGERLEGFVTTTNGWVQSYGTRCVRPPILFGDVARAAPITVDWARYAQSLTRAPVKGMLTGPVTILQWSFVRDDQPRDETCRQIAVAMRDEVLDLEGAGIRVIQVDEPALREGLPLRARDRDRYLDWATSCFRIATAGVRDATQIHTHMCYAEFSDILGAIIALDADVISIEATRSRMAVLDDLASASYPAAVGPGVYDIHSPHVPSQAEIGDLIDRALRVLPADQIWINPDCGLKTRRWEEVRPALKNMVAATRAARAHLLNRTP